MNPNLRRPRAECYVCLARIIVTAQGKISKHRKPPGDDDSMCVGSSHLVRVYDEASKSWIVPSNYKGIPIGSVARCYERDRITLRDIAQMCKDDRKDWAIAKATAQARYYQHQQQTA